MTNKQNLRLTYLSTSIENIVSLDALKVQGDIWVLSDFACVEPVLDLWLITHSSLKLTSF